VSTPAVLVFHSESSALRTDSSVEVEIVVLVLLLSLGLCCVLGCWYTAWEKPAGPGARWPLRDDDSSNDRG